MIDPPPSPTLRWVFRLGGLLLVVAAGISLFGLIMSYSPAYHDMGNRAEMHPEGLVAAQNWLLWTGLAVSVPFAGGLLLLVTGAAAYCLQIWRERSSAGAWQ